MIRLNQIPRLTCKLICCALLIFSGFFHSAAAMATEPVMTGRTTIKLSEIGASDVKVALTTQVTYYTALKQLGSNFNLLARKIGMDGRNWNKLNDLNGSFIDNNNEVDITFNTPGAARVVKGNRWVYSLQGEENCQLVSATDSHVTLMTVEATEIGLGTMVIDVELPAGATKAGFDSHKNEISYEFAPQIENGTSPELQFEVDHKTALMSSLAKNYSNPKFNYMWAARAVAKNTGDQILNNYRVRFRVAEMGSWGAWQRSARLYPGQTVVDPFFPIFDLEKMMSLNGSRPAVIEVEYEYEESNGTKVQESDSFPVQVLSRNEVVYSSLRPEEVTGYADSFDYAPALMTSMTTPADPIVQQLAGRVNGMAAESFGKTIGAVYSDEECVAFMSALWYFLQSNHIAYQSPPGMLTDGKMGQHVKYTRDVLRNRAGTCIDLAITWTSVCEAVGLEPAVVLVPGHAFPAVRLPGSRRWLAVESTMLNSDFNAAVARGEEELTQALAGDHYLIDITELRNQGVLGLDLPNASEDYLTNLGYTFVAQQFNVTPANNDTNTDNAADTTATNFVPNGDQTDINSLTGTWGGYGVFEGMQTWVGLALNGDGSFELLFTYTHADQTTSNEIVRGTWGMQGSKLVLTNTANTPFEYDFEFTGNQLKFCALGGTQVVTLDRKS